MENTEQSEKPPAPFTGVVAQLRAAGCVFADDEAALLVEAAGGAELDALVDRRVEGEPLEHVLGWASFAGLRVPVAPGVFVPRRRTELVAELAVQHLPPGGTLVDLCCGAGAIAMAVVTTRPLAEVWAADIDPVAVALAERSLAALGANVVLGDMDAALPARLAGACEVVAACPPYVPSGQISLMPREARHYEPELALDGGPDGTALQARVFEAAARLLRPGGVAVVETSEHLAPLTVERAAAAGLEPTIERDPARDAVVVLGRRK